MRTHGFGMRAELETDMFFRKTRDAGEGAPGRNPIFSYEFFDTAEQLPFSQLLVALVKIATETNGILA
jgi:hypothetical protein